MSAVAALLHLDGRPVDAATLARMLDAAPWRGPDGRASFVDGPVALGFLAMHTTPEAAVEGQPVVDGRASLVFDGRLDNRDELMAELRLETAPAPGDAALVVAAHRRWGDEAPAHLLGDFAYLLWDGERRRLVCVRDVFGIRPLHYWTNGRTLVAATDIAQLLAHPDVARVPDEEMVGEHLAAEIVSVDRTLYRDVLLLPGAHTLVAEPGGLRRQRYFRLDPGARVVHRSDDEYAEHFRAVFRDAVRSRLRSHMPVVCDLSGGLDSSSVVGMAETLRREGRANCPAVETVSVVYPGWDCDETRYVDAVVERWRVVNHKTEPEACTPALLADMAGRDRDFPPYPNTVAARRALHTARARGARVVLTGGGGDDWLTGGAEHVTCLDHLAAGRVRAAVSELRGSVHPGTVLREMASHWLSRHVPAWDLRPSLRLPDWIEPAFAARTRLADRVRAVWPRSGALAWDPASEGRSEVHALATGGWVPHGMETFERNAASCGIELRHPFFDRRVVELALAIPEDQRRRGRVRRHVERRAMAPLLPADVADRQDKAEFSTLMRRAFADCADLVRRGPLRIAELGWVRPDPLARALSDAARRPDERRLLWPVWMALALEVWAKLL